MRFDGFFLNLTPIILEHQSIYEELNIHSAVVE